MRNPRREMADGDLVVRRSANDGFNHRALINGDRVSGNKAMHRLFEVQQGDHRSRGRGQRCGPHGKLEPEVARAWVDGAGHGRKRGRDAE